MARPRLLEGLTGPEIDQDESPYGGGGSLPTEVTPPFQSAPVEGDSGKYPPSSDPVGGTERPREILGPGRDLPTRPPDVRERSTQASSNPSEDSGYSPGRPKTPTPVASLPPQPFSPMAPLMDPGAMSVAMRAPSISQPTSPSQFGGDSGQGGMFGAAGGLLGGGLGVSGRDDSFGDTEEDPLDSIIRMLLNGQA